MVEELYEDDPRPRLAYDRTLLANERTFASWIRTGLSVAAIGVVVTHVVPERQEPMPHLVVGGAFVALGFLVIALGAWRFVRVNRDLTDSGSPSAVMAPGIVYTLTAVVGALLLALLFLR